jgi:hypothetical protein
VQELAAAIEASGIAGFLRASRWIYPAVNALHLLGIALLVGSVAPMDLRLVGVWRGDVPVATVLRLLRPVAACGAGLAVVTGALLFAVQARDYVALPAFWMKMGLVALGLAHALANPRIGAASRGRQRWAGGLSLGVWVGVLGLGRLLGYL